MAEKEKITEEAIKTAYSEVIKRSGGELIKLSVPEWKIINIAWKVSKENNLLWIFGGIDIHTYSNLISDLGKYFKFQAKKVGKEEKGKSGRRATAPRGWGLGSRLSRSREFSLIDLETDASDISGWNRFISSTFGVDNTPMISDALEELFGIRKYLNLEYSAGLMIGGFTRILTEITLDTSNIEEVSLKTAADFIHRKEWGIYPVAMYSSPLILSFEKTVETKLGQSLKLTGEASEEDKRKVLEILTENPALAKEFDKEYIDAGIPFPRITRFIVYYSLDALLKSILQSMQERRRYRYYEEEPEVSQEKVIAVVKDLFKKAKQELTLEKILSRIKESRIDSALQILQLK